METVQITRSRTYPPEPSIARAVAQLIASCCYISVVVIKKPMDILSLLLPSELSNPSSTPSPVCSTPSSPEAAHQLTSLTPVTMTARITFPKGTIINYAA